MERFRDGIPTGPGPGILKVMSLEGLRLKEAWLLEIRDVDFASGLINLRKEIVKGKYRPRTALLFPDVEKALDATSWRGTSAMSASAPS